MMDRRAKRKKGKTEAKRRLARKSHEDRGRSVRDLENRLAEALEREAEALKREAEAREQQTATSEILRSISASPTDTQPVFDAIARGAVQLCEASFSGVLRFDGALIHLIAHHGVTPEELQAALPFYPLPMRQGGF